MPTLAIIHRRQQAYRFVEDLGAGVQLEMVSIPVGEFMMGSPEGEPGREESEGPPHLVKIASFCLGKYPVTQAQWRVVAAMEPVNQSLELEPSQFKGDDLPVEQVSWWDAVEFCDRLCRKTGKSYRLPTEAEWEYACRAGTTTPFHFGATITPELANYYTEAAYRDAPTQKSLQKTTPVGNFGVANDFGLYDMHGNVHEWCADHWHDNYEDGGAWLSENEGADRLLRGGSWVNAPWYCRSAYRLWDNPDLRIGNVGFRVACSSARTL